MNKALRTALLAATLVTCVQSWPQYIQRSVCEQFHVTHGDDHMNRSLPNDSVLVTLKLDGDAVNCMLPNKYYHVEFSTNVVDSLIKGILVEQESAEEVPLSRGIQTQLKYLPKNTVSGVCSQRTISHSCRSRNGCKLGDNGMYVDITYYTPKPGRMTHDVVIRYTVVLSGGYYVQDQRARFPTCPQPTTPPSREISSMPTTTLPTTTPPVSVKCSKNAGPVATNQAHEPVQEYCPNFSVKDGASMINNGNCNPIDDIPYSSNETHMYTEPLTNINYTCHTTHHVRKAPCKPTCSSPRGDGVQWCCKNMISRTRKRDFTCEHLSPNGVLRKLERLKVEVLQTKKCKCFLCTDIICEGCSEENQSS